MTRKLVAAIACRNQGARLYGKPVQNLDVDNGVRIIDNVVACLKSVEAIDEVVLGISEGIENKPYIDVAEELGLRHIIGDENDVLGRLVACGELAQATDIFRVTSESPFPYFEKIDEVWKQHCEEGSDATFLDNIVDGCSFEIMRHEALATSHRDGEDRHRSELCTLYIRENRDKFKVVQIDADKSLHRLDLRLTVDHPEDLVVCRTIYGALKHQAPRIPVSEIVEFLDRNPDLIKLTAPFAEVGYETMFL